MNKQVILKYLKIFKEPDEKTNQLIDECILEVKELAHFKVETLKVKLFHQPLYIEELNLELNSKDLDFYLKNCHECLLEACTLGINIDRKIKYYEHIDMAKAIVFDAVASRYLEECMDEYEANLNLGIHTFRFAPGYGDIDLQMNHLIAHALKVDKKLGLSISQSGLMIPMKSMIGMIGLGDSSKKSCLSCVRKENCSLRKAGERCYAID